MSEGEQNAAGKTDWKTLAFIIYGLFAAGLLGPLGFFALAAPIGGVILCYMKQGEAQGTWMESHTIWLIRTFWIGIIVSAVIFALTIFTLGIFAIIGIPLSIALGVWYIYRLIKGALAVNEQRPIPDPSGFI